MNDINLIEIKDLTRKANNSLSFNEFRYQYKESYKLLNQMIIDNAKIGVNYILFDFVNTDQKTIENLINSEHQKNSFRIYSENKEWIYAEYDVCDYPVYLIGKGFNVEVRKSTKNHGYKSLSYYISW